MGVSRYPMGLDPLPQAHKDVERMKRVLKQPQFRFELVQCVCDRPLQEMQETLELFFKQRVSDDQIVFLFCGYTLQDTDGRFYFATPNTTLDEQGAIVKAQLIPVSVIQEAMDSSPAKQQVCILDSYQPVSNQPVSNQPAVATAAHISELLASKGRAILTAANVNQPTLTAAIDAWSYTSYLAEGIESGAADTADDGMLTAAALHHYAAQKLQAAAPALKTQIGGSAETAQMPLLEVLRDNPRVHYRKVLEATAIATDAADVPVLEGRSLLNDLRHSLGLSPQEAAALEAQVLRPTQEYRQRLAAYEEHVTESARSHDIADTQRRQGWKQLQQALYLTDQDVAIITIAPSVALKQRQQTQYQGKLAQYQQVLLGAMQRQSPPREGDRMMLQRLQRTLQLGDDDVKTLEAQIAAQTEQFTTADISTASDPPKANAASETSPARSLESNTLSPQPSPPSAVPAAPPDDSRAREAVLQRLFNVNEPDTAALERTPTPNPLPSPVSVQEPLSLLPIAQPNLMDRIRRSASNYQALIIPAILLAAILGLLAAILPSANRPNWFKFGQPSADPTAAQRLNSEGLKKAREGYPKEAIDDYNQAIEKNPGDVAAYINRGVAYHRTGDTGAAIRDYEQALKVDPKSALSHSNLSYAHYDRQNYDQALDEGNQAVALNGNLAEAHINLANARSKKGDYEGALRDYTQALKLSRAATLQAGVYNNRGNVRLALNNARAAINDYNRAIRLQPNYADAHYNLGLAQQALNNRPEAIRNLQKAATLYQSQGKEALQKEATDRASALQQGNLQSLSESPFAVALWR